MTDKPLPRPRQVTFSAWTIVVGSVLTILLAFQRIAELGSLEAQEAAAEFISTAPGSGLGLSVEDVQTAIRLMCLVAGGAAAATAILGWQVLKASRSARVVLSVLAPILFVAGLTSGGLFSALVAAGVLMLWAQPARDWFAGRSPVRDRTGSQAVAGATPYPPPSSPSSAPSSTPASVSSAVPETASTEPAHARTNVTTDQTNPYGVPPPPPGAPGASGPQVAGVRPGRVTAAVITTIVASGLTLLALVGALFFVTASRDDFVTEIDDQLASSSAYDGLSAETVADVSIGFISVLAVWCVLAIVLAVLALRGSGGARIALVVSASLSALVSLLGVLAVVPVVLTIASIAVVVLLLTGGSGDWYAARKRSG